MPGQFVATFIRAAAVKASVDPHVYFKQQLTGVVFLFASVLKWPTSEVFVQVVVTSARPQCQ